MARRFAVPLLAMQLSLNNLGDVVSAASVNDLAEVGSSDNGDVKEKVSAKRLPISEINKF